MQLNKSIKRAVLASSVIGCLSAQAGTDIPAVVDPTTSSSSATGLLVGKLTGDTAMDKAWSAFILYKDENNPILQEFALQGRLQLQTINGKSDGDSFNTSDYKNAGHDDEVWGNDIEARRAQFGFKSKWFQNWKLDGQINVDTDGHDDSNYDNRTLYRSIYDLYLTYAPSDTLNISIGKKEVALGREYEISSKEILTFERGLLTNTLFTGNLTGAWVSGKGIAEHWLYEIGAYGSDRVNEFSNFDAGIVTQLKGGYDYSSTFGLDSAVASVQYMHNSEPGFVGEGGVSPSFTDSIALTNDITHGRFGLTTDILYGFGFNGFVKQNGTSTPINQSDLVGITIIPSYFIADGLQIAGRLQLVSSGDRNGIRVPSRYERLVKGDDERGNTYTSAYLGLNYYLYGHKLKLMSGVEYSMLGGGSYDGYTFLNGLRFSF